VLYVVSGFIVSGSDSQPTLSGWSVGEGTGAVEAEASAEAGADADAAAVATADAEAAAADGADEPAGDDSDEPHDAATSAAANARVQVVRQRFTATPPSRDQGCLSSMSADCVYRVAGFARCARASIG
jgi:cytoskeletal protein RodZ